MPVSRRKPAPGLLSGGSKVTSLTNLVLASVPSPNTRESYAKSIADLFAFAEGQPITRMVLLEWRSSMAAGLASGTVNTRLTAVRSLIREAQNAGVISAEDATDLLRVRGVPRRGARIGNWLTHPEAHALLAVPDRKTLRGKRNYCILALLYGCALRRKEVATLDIEKIQLRNGRWVVADLVSKGGRVRTVTVPIWVKQAVDAWTATAKIKSGRLIRQTTLAPEGLSSQGIWDIVHKAAGKIGVASFGPHDLRRTCARLCRENGEDIEQIQFMLGHADIRTTQIYLGTTQNIDRGPNDGLEP